MQKCNICGKKFRNRGEVRSRMSTEEKYLISLIRIFERLKTAFFVLISLPVLVLWAIFAGVDEDEL